MKPLPKSHCIDITRLNEAAVEIGADVSRPHSEAVPSWLVDWLEDELARTQHGKAAAERLGDYTRLAYETGKYVGFVAVINAIAAASGEAPPLSDQTERLAGGSEPLAEGVVGNS